MDRTLCVILGRPLTLRDEAVDIEYPGQLGTNEIDHSPLSREYNSEPRPKRQRLEQSPYVAAICSFRFDRITAEVKLMLYRVAQSPTRFPWPTNLSEWQVRVEKSCRDLLEEARQDLKSRGIRAGHSLGMYDRTIRLIELKYHQCLMLLNRPSPAIPQPSSSALITCYESAIATLRIQSELARFSNMIVSWITAHAVFVSGITMLYCIWTSHEVRRATSLKTFLEQANACTNLLSTLGKTWPVAKNGQEKFDHLVQITNDSWKLKPDTVSGTITPAQKAMDYPNSPRPVDNFSDFDNLPVGFFDATNADFSIPPSTLMEELGDMGSWFDLDWLGDSTYTF